MSKIYSEINEGELNFDKSLYYLSLAEEIVPNFCDLHYRFVLFYVRTHNLNVLKFLKMIYKGIICGYTTNDSLALFQAYWSQVLSDLVRSKEGRIRYEKYFKLIQEAIEKEGRGERKKRRKKWVTKKSRK